MTKVKVKAYASPGCVLLAFDWPDGKDYEDFLGFAIERRPGYSRGGEPVFLWNKLEFGPVPENARPKPSNLAPIQKFKWWDGGINQADQGKAFKYRVIPVRGAGPANLRLETASEGIISVKVPRVLKGGIATYFNRAVVSAQSWLKLKNVGLQKQMEWLANGIQEALPNLLENSDAFDCAIYHLSDKLWILPAFEEFKGRGSIIYFDKGADSKSRIGARLIHKTRNNISIHRRDAILKLMHDKFVVSYRDGHEKTVLMGSTNFTPEMAGDIL